MENKVFEFSTKTLFRPIIIKIDDHELKVREIDYETLCEIQDRKDELNAGNMTAFRSIFDKILFSEDEKFPVYETMKKMPIRDLKKIIEIIVEESLKARGAEKNESRPGRRTSR